jgi:transposase-like protein
MRKSRFSEEQKVKMLQEADRTSVAAVAKKHGVSAETLYKWRRAYGGMEASEVKRFKQLEQDNARLKKLLAERDLEIEVMKEITAKKW